MILLSHDLRRDINYSDEVVRGNGFEYSGK